ncbi:MAG: cobyrinate a,c-diamide synthase [Bilophila sp.]
MPRLVISGLSGGGGKTLVALGLSRSLTRRGLAVKPCKKGPDYIDAAWLALACGRTATNLDPFFLSDERLRALFFHVCGMGSEKTPPAVALIEGNRGLYDGRDVAGSCSTAALARILDAPILLALNITKMTRTAAAIVAGLAQFEPVRLGGVILNQTGSSRHATLARQAIETYTDIPVLGELPRLKENPIPERHMGLVSIHNESGEATASCADQTLLQSLDKLADFLEAHVDIDAVLTLAHSAPAMPAQAPFWKESLADTPRPRIGFVRDAALWFYYEENLEALRRAGAELVELSLLSDAPWDKGLDGLYLGGGFPEMLAQRLSQSPHLATIRAFSLDGMPLYAECGGFMILCESLRINGHDYPMSGLFPARAEFCSRPQGLGYVEATVLKENPFHPVGAVLRGHEFHYSRCVALDTLVPTLQLCPGTGMSGTPDKLPKGSLLQGQDGLLVRNTFAAYTHLFAPAVPHWASAFVRACRAFAQK